MGGGASLVNSTVREDERRSKSIDLSLAEDRHRLMNVIQIVLIGDTYSGKSTFSKQLRLIFNKGFNREERLAFRTVIRENVVSALLSVLDHCPLDWETMDVDSFEDDYTMLHNALRSNDAGDVIVDIRDIVLRVVQHENFNTCLLTSGQELALQSATREYLGCLERILSPDYLPTDHDILRSRSKTVGVKETTFTYKAYDYRVYDSGGQNSLCRKWIHCFDDVTALIFTVDMSSYDREPPTGKKPPLLENIAQFEDICHLPCFSQAAIFLFLNKKDEFERKLRTTPLSTCFPDYKGRSDYAEASRYVQWRFERVAGPDTVVHSHFTTATDTGSVRQVLDSCLGVTMGVKSNPH